MYGVSRSRDLATEKATDFLGKYTCRHVMVQTCNHIDMMKGKAILGKGKAGLTLVPLMA